VLEPGDVREVADGPLLGGGLDGGLAVGVVREVRFGGDEPALAADALDDVGRLGEPRLVDIEPDGRQTVVRERGGRHPADARARAGDDGHGVGREVRRIDREDAVGGQFLGFEVVGPVGHHRRFGPGALITRRSGRGRASSCDRPAGLPGGRGAPAAGVPDDA
jgi:hypothetical protein